MDPAHSPGDGDACSHLLHLANGAGIHGQVLSAEVAGAVYGLLRRKNLAEGGAAMAIATLLNVPLSSAKPTLLLRSGFLRRPLVLIRDHAVHKASVIAAAPRSGIRVFVNQQTRRIGSAPGDPDVVDNDNCSVARPFYLNRHRRRDVLAAILDARLDHPHVAAHLVHA